MKDRAVSLRSSCTLRRTEEATHGKNHSENRIAWMRTPLRMPGCSTSEILRENVQHVDVQRHASANYALPLTKSCRIFLCTAGKIGFTSSQRPSSARDRPGQEQTCRRLPSNVFYPRTLNNCNFALCFCAYRENTLWSFQKTWIIWKNILWEQTGLFCSNKICLNLGRHFRMCTCQ